MKKSEKQRQNKINTKIYLMANIVTDPKWQIFEKVDHPTRIALSIVSWLQV